MRSGSGFGWDAPTIEEIIKLTELSVRHIEDEFISLNMAMEMADGWLGTSSQAYKEKFKGLVHDASKNVNSIIEFNDNVKMSLMRLQEDQKQSQQMANQLPGY